MKLQINLDTENKDDITILGKIHKAISDDKASSDDLKRYIEKVVKRVINSK